ncbi:MAG: glycosyltransferase [bacterium]
MMDLSVCILNYNTADQACECIKSVLKHTKDLKYETIVVDNASTDGSVGLLREKFGDRIVLIQNKTNRYFTGGFNDAIFLAEGKYTALVNSDTYIVDNALKYMVDFLETHHMAGAVEAITINDHTNAAINTSTRELTPFRDLLDHSKLLRMIFRSEYARYRYTDWDRESDREVEVLGNAFMMARSDLFKEIGGLNEALKMYYTEYPFSHALRRRGYQLWHLAGARAFHAVGAATGKTDARLVSAIQRTDGDIYFALKEIMDEPAPSGGKFDRLGRRIKKYFFRLLRILP